MILLASNVTSSNVGFLLLPILVAVLCLVAVCLGPKGDPRPIAEIKRQRERDRDALAKWYGRWPYKRNVAK